MRQLLIVAGVSGALILGSGMAAFAHSTGPAASLTGGTTANHLPDPATEPPTEQTQPEPTDTTETTEPTETAEPAEASEASEAPETPEQGDQKDQENNTESEAGD